MLSRRWWCALALVTLLGLALRAYGTGDYWFNPDEGIFYRVATTPAASFRGEMAIRVNPPLFYLGVRLVSLFSHDPVWLRSISVAAGTLLIPVIGLLGAELGGALTGLAAALLVSLSPGAVLLSRLIRPYMVMLPLLAAAFLFLARFDRTRRARDAWWFSLFMTLSVGTHYSVFLDLLAILPLVAAFFLVGRWKRREGGILLWASIPALAGAGLLFLYHIGPHLLECPQRANSVSGYLAPFMAEGVGDLWLNFLGLSRYLFGRLSTWLLLPLVLLGLALALWRRRYLLTGLSLAPLLVAALLSFLSLYPFGGSRHSSHLVFAMVLPPAFALGSLAGISRRGAALATLLAAALLSVGLGRLVPGNHQTSHPSAFEFTLRTDDLKRLEAHLAALKESDGVILIDSQTSEALHPLLKRELGPAEHLGGGDFTRFRWGRRQIVKVGAWEFSPEALAETLDRLMSADPDWPPPGDLRVIQAGWSRDLRARMVPLLGQASVNSLVDRVRSTRGFVSFRLKPRRFLKRMERMTPFSIDPRNPLAENLSHVD